VTKKDINGHIKASPIILLHQQLLPTTHWHIVPNPASKIPTQDATSVLLTNSAHALWDFYEKVSELPMFATRDAI
jgi:hypothetical protein